MLYYYDKTYVHSVLKRENQTICSVTLESHDPAENAKLILEAVKSIK